VKGRVYLDWNATAPLRPEAREAMVAALDVVGNPSSVHAEGRAAKGIIETARRQVAALVGCAPGEVVFTSGATEAAALVLSGAGTSLASRNFPSPVEHDCVFAHFNCWGDNGEPGLLDEWFFNTDGSLQPMFDQGLYELAIEDGQILSVCAANGETGIINAIKEFAPKSDQIFQLFVDAVQAVGKTGFNFSELGADFAILSAHKLGGPKGVGALIIKSGTDVPAVLKGGGQEMGRRSGTENVAGIAGFGAACEAAARDLEAGVWDRVAELRNILEKALASAANETNFIGKDAPRLPNTSCFATPGWKGETQVMQMDLAGFAISAGSACSSGKVKESRVLRAMGHPPEVASSAVRVSLGPTTTEGDVMAFAEAWLAQHEKFRRRAA